MSKRGLIVIPILSAMLVACGSQTPSVEFEEVSQRKPDLEGLVKFSLPKTIFIFDYKDPKTKDTVVLTAVPGEWESRLFQIRPSDPWLRKSNFKWTKRDNTNLLQQVGSEVEDNRVTTIQTIGAAIGSVMGVVLLAQDFELKGAEPPKVAKAPDGLKLPLAVDTATYLANYPVPNTPITDKTSDGTSEAEGGIVAFKIQFGSLPADAIPLEDYLRDTAGKRQNALFTSACRTATITFNSGPLEGQKYSSTVADPNFVQTIAMPPNGTVSMHSVCGANVLSEKATVSTNTEIINELLAQAKSLSETWKSEKKKAEAKQKAKTAGS
ncbi:hypothetical protein [Pseudomonas putida]